MSATNSVGGKEELIALGWSRQRKIGTPYGSPTYPTELWTKKHKHGYDYGVTVAISADGACFMCRDVFDEFAQWASAEEMRAVLKRIEELKAGDAE